LSIQLRKWIWSVIEEDEAIIDIGGTKLVMHTRGRQGRRIVVVERKW